MACQKHEVVRRFGHLEGCAVARKGWHLLQGFDYADGRHHDSQEFLNWCLQKLSEANNRIKAPKGTPQSTPSQTNNKAASPPASLAVSEAPSTGPPSEGRLSRAAADCGSTCAQAEASAKWQEGLAREASAVLDVFQGQLQSCVVCSVCGTTSYTYEAFTSLQVAPHKDGVLLLECCSALGIALGLKLATFSLPSIILFRHVWVQN
jgi:hypothetical protein